MLLRRGERAGRRRARRATATAVTALAVALLAAACGGGTPGAGLSGGWEGVRARAEGQTVRWWMFGGDARVNAYVRDHVVPAAGREGVRLVIVPVEDTADAVQRVIAEREAGRETGGAVDLIWINGENFALGKELGLWLRGWAPRLPNAGLVDMEDPSIATDFGVPVEGQEAPWSRAAFVFARDPVRVPQPPATVEELLSWARANPGRFTYPAPPDFTGSAFVRLAAQELGEDRAMAELRALRPLLHGGGRSLPKSEAELNRLLGDGEVDVAMSYDPSFVRSGVRTGIFPSRIRPFALRRTLVNTSFVTIPANASSPEGAAVVANLLLSPRLQTLKADPEVLGLPTVLDPRRLPTAARAALRRAASASPHTLAPDELGEPLAELPPDDVTRLEARWRREVLRVAGLRCSGVTALPGGAPVLRGVDLEVPAGGRLALIGPSGAGKTTLLRAIAGLEPSAAGRIDAGGRPLAGLPPHRRPIAMVFQEPRLMPHLDVAENVAFGLRAARVPRRERRARADELLAEVGLAGLGPRSPGGLSGGEQQRVALARALCRDPRLLLLDEPTAAVDPDRRRALRRLLLRLHEARRVTTVVVTHDRDEAAELGEHVALMIEGRIVQCAPPRELFLRPASPAVARFLGLRNVVAGMVRDGALATPAGPLPAPGPDGPARIVIRPEGVRLDPAGPLRMTLAGATFLASGLRLVLRRNEFELEALAPADADAPEAGEVAVAVAPEAVWRFPGGSVAATPGGAAMWRANSARAVAAVAPAVLVVAGLWAAGMVGAVRASLGVSLLRGWSEAGLGAYRALAWDPDFWDALAFTLRIAAGATALSAALAIALASLLRRSGGLARALAAAPVPMPHLLAAVLAALWLGPGGIADRLVGALPVDLVRDPHGLGVILVYVYKETPFLTLLVLAAWTPAVAAREEAAAVLGAGVLGRLRWVVWPAIRAPLVTGSAIVAAFVIGALEVPLVVGPTSPRTLSELALGATRTASPDGRAVASAALLVASALALGVAAAAAAVGLRRRGG